MKKHYLTSIMLPGFVLCALAETTLSGKIGGMTFDSTGNPFIIQSNLTVEEHKTVTINSGCIFLFQPYTGIEINGNFIVNGAKQSPVVFTSKNDRNYTENSDTIAQPFDWNGIVVTAKATRFEVSNFLLSYSVFGIKAEKDSISVSNGVFMQNGQCNLTIGGKTQMVKDNFPISYREKIPLQSMPQTVNEKLRKPKVYSPMRAMIFSGILPGGGLYYTGTWQWGALYTAGTIGAAVSAVLFGHRAIGRTCGECSGWKNGSIIQWSGCIEGEWITNTSTFSTNTFYGQVAQQQGWTETYGGIATITKGKFTPNIPIIVAGSIVYAANIVHAGIAAKRKMEKKTKITLESQFDTERMGIGIAYNF